jgi:hypothetical protein
VVQDAEKGEPNSDADAIAEFTGAKNEEERELAVTNLNKVCPDVGM